MVNLAVIEFLKSVTASHRSTLGVHSATPCDALFNIKLPTNFPFTPSLQSWKQDVGGFLETECVWSYLPAATEQPAPLGTREVKFVEEVTRCRENRRLDPGNP